MRLAPFLYEMRNSKERLDKPMVSKCIIDIEVFSSNAVEILIIMNNHKGSEPVLTIEPNSIQKPIHDFPK